MKASVNKLDISFSPFFADYHEFPPLDYSKFFDNFLREKKMNWISYTFKKGPYIRKISVCYIQNSVNKYETFRLSFLKIR